MESQVKDQKKPQGNQNVPVTRQPDRLSTHKVFDEEIIVKVNDYLKQKESEGLALPSDYNATNALAAAKLHLLNLKDDSGKLIVDQCTLPSVVNALTTMVLSGYNVSKKHCAFIKYGDQLVCQPEYFGHLMVAKRDADVKDVNAQCVYHGDEFVYEVDTTTGRIKLIKHIPKLENQDITKIKGAYAIVKFEDGSTKMEVMTLAQIKNAWNMGTAKGNSKLHNNFTDQACKKTVMTRAVKIEINSSDDSELQGDDFALQAREKNRADKENKKEVKTEDIDYEDVNNGNKQEPGKEKHPYGKDEKVFNGNETLLTTEEAMPETAVGENLSPEDPGY